MSEYYRFEFWETDYEFLLTSAKYVESINSTFKFFNNISCKIKMRYDTFM